MVMTSGEAESDEMGMTCQIWQPHVLRSATAGLAQ